MLICPKCGRKYPLMSKFCKECGTKLVEDHPNTCSNPACPNSKVKLGNTDKYCDQCGSPTTYQKEVEKNI